MRARTTLILILTFAMLLVFGASPALGGGNGAGGPSVHSIQGLTQVEGEDVIVEVLVLVRPGENGREVARAALKRLYPLAKEVDSANYTFNGLEWDDFSNPAVSDPKVIVNYNDKSAPSSLADKTTRKGVLLTTLATWTGVPSSSFKYDYGADTGRCPSLVLECKRPQKFDSYNDVGWLNIAKPGVLCVTWYGTLTDEFDMVLDNRNYTWYIGAEPVTPGGVAR